MNECLDETDKFKTMFKKYKKFNSNHNLDVIDFHYPHLFTHQISRIPIIEKPLKECPIKDDIYDISECEMFTLRNFNAGLYVIPKILTKEASHEWYNYLLNELPVTHSDSLKANISLPPSQPIEKSNLRWITFGYHHNWDTKVYEKHVISQIPPKIKHFVECVRELLGFNHFIPEAGIINYYNCKSTLCPHSDHSEPNKTAPIFSLSLGNSAIFLIGGASRDSDTPIYPLLLHDSDLLIMSSECRESIHAVPKIICDTNGVDCGTIKRINVNIRQVY